MQKDILSKIDLLVEMSGTTNNYETLQEELLLLERKIEDQKNKVRDLKKSVSENSYIKASDRIIDENVKIGIENKLEYYENSLSKVEEQIAKQLKEEKRVHDEVSSLESECNQNQVFLESLELKLKTIGSKDKSIYDSYVHLIEETKQDIENVSENLKAVRSEYQSLCDTLDNLGNTREDLENKLAKEKERLNEVSRFLANPNSYVDQTAKQNDERLIDRLMDELEEMEHRKLEILTDPVYIAHDAVSSLMNDDNSEALTKIKELVTIVKDKPYMDVDKGELAEILENATSKRDALATEIENKNYEGQAMDIVNFRITYLEKVKKSLEEEILLLKSKIKNMDVEEIQELLNYVADAKKTRAELKNSMNEYQKVMDSNKEFKTPKKEATLRAAYKKKEEEYGYVDKIVLAFEKDLEKLVLTSSELEENTLTKLENNLKNIEEEIKELKKNQMMRTGTKDILAVEKDKETLKELNDDVQNIVRRQKYDSKPDEIFDEIELALGSMSDDEDEPVDIKPQDFVDLNDYRISLDEPKVEEPVIENKVIEPVIPEPVSLEETASLEPVVDDSVIFEPIHEDVQEEVKEESLNTDVEVLPNKEEDKEEKKEEVERYKVIAVEPIVTNENLPKEEPEEKKDNDSEEEYISFNNLLEEDRANENFS